MYSCYLVKRASSRETGDCRFLWISEVFCLISLLIQSRTISSDARVFGNTSNFVLLNMKRSTVGNKVRVKEKILHNDHLPPSCNNCAFLSVCLRFVFTKPHLVILRPLRFGGWILWGNETQYILGFQCIMNCLCVLILQMCKMFFSVYRFSNYILL